jgi:hypothetical protein
VEILSLHLTYLVLLHPEQHVATQVQLTEKTTLLYKSKTSKGEKSCSQPCVTTGRSSKQSQRAACSARGFKVCPIRPSFDSVPAHPDSSICRLGGKRQTKIYTACWRETDRLEMLFINNHHNVTITVVSIRDIKSPPSPSPL